VFEKFLQKLLLSSSKHFPTGARLAITHKPFSHHFPFPQLVPNAAGADENPRTPF
jgi:hypothetical protein